MSHAGSWRAARLIRDWILILHLEKPSIARGVTAPGVGSGALFGLFSIFFEKADPESKMGAEERETRPIQATSNRAPCSTRDTYLNRTDTLSILPPARETSED